MRYFTLIVALFLPSLLWQQSNRVFKLKPAIGLNACQIHGDAYSGYNKLGLFVGTAVQTKLNEKVSAELAFYFSQKGARRNEIPKNNDYRSYLVNLNYIDMPLSFFYKLNNYYSVMAGPSIAYLVSSKEYINRIDMSAYSHFNKFEIGLNIGLSRKIKDNWYAEIRCSNSVSPVRNYGIAATGIYYPNPVARYFNKGLYNNILSIFVTYIIDSNKSGGN